MKKIPCLFQRDFTNQRNPILLESVTPGCEWVLDFEGKATRKFDGTAVAIIAGVLYARYDVKKGKTVPEGAIPCCEPDEVTGHWPHWVPTVGPDFIWIRAAAVNTFGLEDGTYEAVGPKINGNHDLFLDHVLVKHGAEEVTPSRSFHALSQFLGNHQIEGIVFHHPDGRMAKITRRNYGYQWPPDTVFFGMDEASKEKT